MTCRVATAYDSLLSAWKDYLAHDNHGRPIIFIGHSQGAAMLIRLLQTQVDPSPSLRRRMVSAIILGATCRSRRAGTSEARFRNIPTCRSASQTGCVIAYSSFGSTPPANSLFGRAGPGGQPAVRQGERGSQQVACVNPVTFSSRAGRLAAVLPRRHLADAGRPGPDTLGDLSGPLHRAVPAERRGILAAGDGHPGSGDPRPTVSASLGPQWGYHLDDVNLALGNLVTDVGLQEAAYR